MIELELVLVDRALCSQSSMGGKNMLSRRYVIFKETSISCLLCLDCRLYMYRPEDVSIYSQLCHPNVINLEAVLIGQEHELFKNRFHAY